MVRHRDPNRRQAILDAAARLVAERGHAAVSMADIGAAVGIAASAIYWHFPSKVQLLVELFDACLDRLLTEQRRAIGELGRTEAALHDVTRLQVRFVVDERAFARVYHSEARLLPADELFRLHAKQRSYAQTWLQLLCELRPDVPAAEAEDLVHAAIGATGDELLEPRVRARRYGKQRKP